ncbi:hypothetical protein PN836_010185 [Ningiella sp. W23]|uniref:hypothetical protein n=1 Tax=Ningiella sp. W23 TaxID=3023715 RepID=UPI0037564CDE
MRDILRPLHHKPTQIALYAALAAVLIGLITFSLSWNFFDYWGGPIFGYSVLLFPGNLSLVYFWHPIFTEEVDLLPKLAMLLTGQFVLVYLFTFLVVKTVRQAKSKYDL